LPKSSSIGLIAELRDQLDQAQATIFQLKQLLRTQGGYPHEEITLTPTQRKVVDVLLQTDGISTKEHLYHALYASKPSHAPDPKILREIIRLIRKRLKSRGIEISFVAGKGYTISDANEVKLKETISAKHIVLRLYSILIMPIFPRGLSLGQIESGWILKRLVPFAPEYRKCPVLKPYTLLRGVPP
jgi:DNA-binding winged helix-turn-helix (wHTH) protein